MLPIRTGWRWWRCSHWNWNWLQTCWTSTSRHLCSVNTWENETLNTFFLIDWSILCFLLEPVDAGGAVLIGSTGFRLAKGSTSRRLCTVGSINTARNRGRAQQKLYHKKERTNIQDQFEKNTNKRWYSSSVIYTPSICFIWPMHDGIS